MRLLVLFFLSMTFGFTVFGKTANTKTKAFDFKPYTPLTKKQLSTPKTRKINALLKAQYQTQYEILHSEFLKNPNIFKKKKSAAYFLKLFSPAYAFSAKIGDDCPFLGHDGQIRLAKAGYLYCSPKKKKFCTPDGQPSATNQGFHYCNSTQYGHTFPKGGLSNPEAYREHCVALRADSSVLCAKEAFNFHKDNIKTAQESRTYYTISDTRTARSIGGPVVNPAKISGIIAREVAEAKKTCQGVIRFLEKNPAGNPRIRSGASVAEKEKCLADDPSRATLDKETRFAESARCTCAPLGETLDLRNRLASCAAKNYQGDDCDFDKLLKGEFIPPVKPEFPVPEYLSSVKCIKEVYKDKISNRDLALISLGMQIYGRDVDAHYEDRNNGAYKITNSDNSDYLVNYSSTYKYNRDKSRSMARGKVSPNKMFLRRVLENIQSRGYCPQTQNNDLELNANQKQWLTQGINGATKRTTGGNDGSVFNEIFGIRPNLLANSFRLCREFGTTGGHRDWGSCGVEERRITWNREAKKIKKRSMRNPSSETRKTIACFDHRSTQIKGDQGGKKSKGKLYNPTSFNSLCLEAAKNCGLMDDINLYRVHGNKKKRKLLYPDLSQNEAKEKAVLDLLCNKTTGADTRNLYYKKVNLVDVTGPATGHESSR